MTLPYAWVRECLCSDKAMSVGEALELKPDPHDASTSRIRPARRVAVGSDASEIGGRRARGRALVAGGTPGAQPFAVHCDGAGDVRELRCAGGDGQPQVQTVGAPEARPRDGPVGGDTLSGGEREGSAVGELAVRGSDAAVGRDALVVMASGPELQREDLVHER